MASLKGALWPTLIEAPGDGAVLSTEPLPSHPNSSPSQLQISLSLHPGTPRHAAAHFCQCSNMGMSTDNNTSL